MIKVLFFSRLREQLGCDQLLVSDFAGTNVRELLHHLQRKRPEWRDIFAQQKVLSAVNQVMATSETRILANDEVAFFPQVTGG
jgi:molybdopterin synthase sulfur carrier subunit